MFTFFQFWASLEMAHRDFFFLIWKTSLTCVNTCRMPLFSSSSFTGPEDLCMLITCFGLCWKTYKHMACYQHFPIENRKLRWYSLPGQKGHCKERSHKNIKWNKSTKIHTVKYIHCGAYSYYFIHLCLRSSWSSSSQPRALLEPGSSGTCQTSSYHILGTPSLIKDLQQKISEKTIETDNTLGKQEKY